MIVRKSVLEVRTLQNWLLNVVLSGLIFLIAYLAIGLVTSTSKDQTAPAALQSLSKVPRVDVVNGCGVSGVALQFAQFLSAHGIDVVEVGNHNTFDVEESVVVDRVGNFDAAMHVAVVLGIPRSNVIQQVNQEYFLDVSIVIGKNYNQLQPYRP
ncbi:MAG: LytR C-terminal domain-containing protein [Bacteroidota bacterium]